MLFKVVDVLRLRSVVHHLDIQRHIQHLKKKKKKSFQHTDYKKEQPRSVEQEVKQLGKR